MDAQTLLFIIGCVVAAVLAGIDIARAPRGSALTSWGVVIIAVLLVWRAI